MGKFDRFEHIQEKKTSGPTTHPVWRGIGCIMLVLIPLMAFAAADMFYDDAPSIRIFGSPIFQRSGAVYQILVHEELWDGAVLRISGFHIIFMILFSLIGFLILSFVYAVVYRASGLSKPGPTDAPPPRRSGRRRRR
jgi:hypothetical protein